MFTVPGVRGGGGSPVMRSNRSAVVCSKKRPSSMCSRTRGSSSGLCAGGIDRVAHRDDVAGDLGDIDRFDRWNVRHRADRDADAIADRPARA